MILLAVLFLDNVSIGISMLPIECNYRLKLLFSLTVSRSIQWEDGGGDNPRNADTPMDADPYRATMGRAVIG